MTAGIDAWASALLPVSVRAYTHPLCCVVLCCCCCPVAVARIPAIGGGSAALLLLVAAAVVVALRRRNHRTAALHAGLPAAKHSDDERQVSVNPAFLGVATTPPDNGLRYGTIAVGTGGPTVAARRQRGSRRDQSEPLPSLPLPPLPPLPQHQQQGQQQLQGESFDEPDTSISGSDNYEALWPEESRASAPGPQQEHAWDSSVYDVDDTPSTGQLYESLEDSNEPVYDVAIIGQGERAEDTRMSGGVQATIGTGDSALYEGIDA